jgi:hypothetical protein
MSLVRIFERLTAIKGILIWSARAVRNFESSLSFGHILVEIDIGAFIKPMMRRFRRWWPIEVVHISKAVSS